MVIGFMSTWFLQLEDCVDCCIVLYQEHDVLFMLDHSCGHDRQRQGGLNAKNMNKSFGGNQPKMCDTMIQQEQGFWGPYLRQLQPGDEQKFHMKTLTLALFGCPMMSRRSTIMILL